MRTIFNWSIILTFLLIGFSVFYYLVIFIPSKEQSKLDLQKQEQQTKNLEKSTNSKLLQDCLNDVNQRFSKILEDYKGKLDNQAAKLILDEKNNQKDECYKRYSQ